MQWAATAWIAGGFSLAATTGALAIAPVTVFGLTFPEKVGGFTLNDSMNFERTSPGQGYVMDYTMPGWKLDVFVYDLKRREIPADVNSAIVRAEFERSRGDVFLAHPRGPYAQVYLRRNFAIDDGSKRLRFQCAAFHLTRDGAKPQDGFMCVTSLRNKFVRLRLTTLADDRTESEARKLVATWIPVLWSGPNAAAAPAPRAAPRRAAPRRAGPPPRRPPPRPRLPYGYGYR